MDKKNKADAAPVQGASLVDPVYQKFARSVVRALGSSEFYRFFMDAIARADNEIQFSNRKEVKTIDPLWVEQIEAALPGFQHVVSLPRQEIKEEEIIVNVAHAKKTGQEVVRHLASHADLVEDYQEESGDVRPSRVMQKYREETIGLYENRLVFTAMESAYHFVKIRHDALFSAMSDEFGAKLKVRSDMDSVTEHVHMDMFLHIKNTESILDTDAKNREIFDRISRLYRMLGVFMNTDFARQMARLDRIRGPIHKTNILKRNPHYRSAVKLLEFLRSYDQVGYVIQVAEQNPVVDEQFQEDIFRNILFNYLVLKGHLEDEKDREVPLSRKPHQKTLKPRFIRQIVEELTEDYDLPDVEIRKVLIEELTKEQLMQEEAAERRRLVEEQERRKKEEAERLAAEKKAEAERLKAEKEAERERIRREKEAEQKRREAERILREAEDRRRSELFGKELDRFRDGLEARLAARLAQEEEQKLLKEKEDYAEAVRLLEEEEQRRKDDAARERKLRREERERQRLEEERARLAREAAEAEERRRREEEEREKQRQLDLAALKPYTEEAEWVLSRLSGRLQLRRAQEEQARKDEEKRQAERRERLARRNADKG